MRDTIQETFDEFGRACGAVKKSGSWQRRSAETIVVLNLQKSNYARRYYVNVAVWLLALGDVSAPKEHKCHVRTRLDELLPDGVSARLTELLDLDVSMQDEDRRKDFSVLLTEYLQPLVAEAATMAGLRSDIGKRLVERSLVTGPAQRLLHSAHQP